MNGFRNLPRIFLLAFALAAVPPALNAQEATRPPTLVGRMLECAEKTVNVCAEPARQAKTPVTRVVVAVVCTVVYVVCTLS